MDVSTIGYVACALVIFLLAIRVPIAWAIGGVAVVALFFVFAMRTGEFIPDRALLRTLSITFSAVMLFWLDAFHDGLMAFLVPA